MNKKKPKILIASSSFYRFPKISKKTWEKLERKYEITKNPFQRRLTQDELIKYGRECCGIIAGLETFNKTVFKNLAGSLRCISRDGVGLDTIDLDAAKKYGIVVRNTPSAVTNAVAEFAIGLVISILRKIPQINNDLHVGKWNQIHGNLLEGKTVGIIGVGLIGKKVAELLKPFNCKIIGNDVKPDIGWFKKNEILHVSKNYLFKKSDIITLHPSFSAGNKYLINEKMLAKMKKGVIIINLSRGMIIEEKVLVKKLREGFVAGAALDVFEREPYKGPLTKMENVILTPHISGSTEESRYLMQMGAIENLVEELEKIK